MTIDQLYIGNNISSFKELKVAGELVQIGNESYYKISNSNAMRPFFMSIVSDSNHWMFLASNGGLSAGRKDSNNALFPYYTDDKITESVETTGSKTILHVKLNDKFYLWEPFSDKYSHIYDIRRNLYKNIYGNKVIFEEINHDLGLTIQYQWNSSNAFGFVKKTKIINQKDNQVEVSVLDGIQNILPYGVHEETQNTRSNLVDAYKKNELEPDSGIGIYALSSIIVDRAEPSEALKATIAWSAGIDAQVHLISSLQLEAFRSGKTITTETDIRAEKGAYFIKSTFTLEPRTTNSWMLVANVNQTISAINLLSEKIKKDEHLIETIEIDIANGTKHLLELARASDGLQVTADKLNNTRHFANTLFNIMRGGIFDHNYQIEKKDFISYMVKANKHVAKKHNEILGNLPSIFSLSNVKELVQGSEDSDLKRLCYEYLPLKFSRRHGDPSRPWNKFSINTKSELDGSKILDYQGNWRDIFQNWEALAHSYPEFIENMIHKFLNATTFEGYNPYRVTKDGFDWEVIEENDPWSYIGYWGDHQIIYLLKFLEFMENHYPNKLASSFNQELFVYANVPYKIKSYAETLKNPKDTIEFDAHLDHKLVERKSKLGADGALLGAKNKEIYHVSLIEKLLATLLSKVSNFIPEGGIWLNTQRPEWNDANNALVGNGVSMVTLYYLRRFVNFFEKLIVDFDEEALISQELKLFFDQVVATLDKNKQMLSSKISNRDRKLVLDGLGIAGSTYRASIYTKGFSNQKQKISKRELMAFLDLAKKFFDHTIEANERKDKLYHSYNLMGVEHQNEISISRLNEMLEGQVAVLSSGKLSPKEALELLDALKQSALYREDQNSYILYPNKDLKRFVAKNCIPEKYIAQSKLLKELVKDGNTQIIEKDNLGQYHFNGNFNNANSVKDALLQLDEKYGALVAKDEELLLEAFEKVFDHRSFTGRSGTFFGYEGLGSIYWHMVSKLLLAVQENCLAAVNANEGDSIIGRLQDHYYEIFEGIGVHKSPDLYGAFPTDPYSHTPAGKGAQQPGMTGQVKEDILTRFGELGVSVQDGKLQFDPKLLRKEEFLTAEEIFKFETVDGKQKEITLTPNSLCFSYCQVPIVYGLAGNNGLTIHYKDGATQNLEDMSLDQNLSRKIFERDGTVEQITVNIMMP